MEMHLQLATVVGSFAVNEPFVVHVGGQVPHDQAVDLRGRKEDFPGNSADVGGGGEGSSAHVGSEDSRGANCEEAWGFGGGGELLDGGG